MFEFKRLDKRSKAILYLINSALFFALMSVFVKLSGDIPALEKSFFRNIVSFVVAFYLVAKNKSLFFGKKENRKLLFFRALFGTIGLTANFYAISHLVLSDANMLNQLSPFFVVIFSSIFLKEKIKKEQFIMLFTAFLGGMFIIRPSFSFEVVPALIGLLSAVAAGSAYTFLRALSGKENSSTIVFFFSAFSLVSLIPFIIFDYTPITLVQLLELIVAGICASVGQFSITAAYKNAPAKEISIYSYTQILFTTVFGIVIFDQIPTLMSFIGYFIVISASIMMFFYNKKHH